MNYFYTFIKADQFITLSGSGEDPTDIKDLEWTSSPGAKDVLEQMSNIDSVYSPTTGFVRVSGHKNNIYVQMAKFDNIYKDGWRFENSNVPAPESDVKKAKTKQRVYVPASTHHKAYYRMQNVGSAEVKDVDNIWDMTVTEFNVLMGTTKLELKEKYVNSFKYGEEDTHWKLQELVDIMPKFMSDMCVAHPSSMMDLDRSLHEIAIVDALGLGEDVPLRVLKDYPELAEKYEIDISDDAVAATPLLSGDFKHLRDMTKDVYDATIESVRKDYDKNTDHVRDLDLKGVYSDELRNVKKAAKTRKRVFKNLPQHMQLGSTSDTMNKAKHYEGIIFAVKNGKNVPDSVKEQYPMIFTDAAINFASTGDPESDAAVNEVLTDIRDKLGDMNYVTGEPKTRMEYRTRLMAAVKEVIGATGENVPTYLVGMSDEAQFAVREGVDKLSGFLGPNIVEKMKNADGHVGIYYDRNETRPYCSKGNITLSKDSIAPSLYSVDEGRITVDDNTLMHEYGHSIEYYVPKIKKACGDFLYTRTLGERLVKLSDVVVNGGYDYDENTTVDHFMSAYTGKRYADGSTEILSMGLGYIGSEWSTTDLMLEDPEYLGFIVAVAAGKIGCKETVFGITKKMEKTEGDTIEIDLYKLLNTSGLTRKRVLVRKKGGAPFWSTRWVQEGDTVKDTVEAAGFELIEVEGEEPEIKVVDLKELIQSARDAGKAAFKAGLSSQSADDPALAEIISQNTHGVSSELKIHEAWMNGWHRANANEPVPGVFDEPEPRKPTGFMQIEDWGRVGTVTVADLKGGDIEVMDGGMERPIIAVQTDFDAVIPSRTVVFGPFTGAPKEVGNTIVLLRNDFEVPLKEFVETTAQPDNFDTMPDEEDKPEPKPDVQPATPTASRVTDTKTISGWSGKRPAMKVSSLQVGDIQLFSNGESLKIKEIRRSGKSYILTYVDYIDERTGKYWETKKQGRALVGVLIPKEKPDNFDTMPDTKRLTVADVEIPAFRAGEEAFGRGTPATHGGDDPELIKILESLAHLDDDEKFKVLRHWLDGWDNAKLKADIAARPKVETPQYGAPLSDRIDKSTKMNVPGVGRTPAIKIKDVQIGDRLQFTDGVYEVKGVIVKGASSIITFHEKDNNGNDLKLKKQNRSFVPVERTQLTPGGYRPMPETPGRKATPHWAMVDESKEEARTYVSTASDFVPAKNVKEATDRLEHQFLKEEADIIHFTRSREGIDFDGLKLPQLNSIIDGLERTIGKHNIKLDHIGWNEKKQRYAAMYSYLGSYRAILFQKTATKNTKAHQKKTLKNFATAKDRNLAKYEKYLGYKEMNPGHHDDLRNRMAKLEKLTRWVVDGDLDNQLLGVVVHEGHHAIYLQNNLRDAWYDNIRTLVGPDLSSNIKCATVSEYGMTEMGELFSEVGVAVEFGVEIDPDVKQAYLNTMETIK